MIGEYDYYGELDAEPEADWPGELPEHIEEWNQWWFEATFESPRCSQFFRETLHDAA